MSYSVSSICRIRAILLQKPFDQTLLGINVLVILVCHTLKYAFPFPNVLNSFYLSIYPDIDGKYTLHATFSGTESYYLSNAVTAFLVDNVPTSTTAPSTALPLSVADAFFVPAIAGIFVLVIIILSAVILLTLRK